MAVTAANPQVLEFYKSLPFNYHGSASAQANMIRARDAVEAYPVLLPLLRPGLTVLEVGCGAGWFALSLRLHHRCQVLGIDFNPVAVARATEMAQLLRQDVRFEVADLFAFDLPQPVELVVSLGVLHHTNDCHWALERICNRFVRPGGHVFIGLYHAHGRRCFLDHFAQMKARRVSEEAMFAEYRRLHAQLQDDVFARSWFRDQVLHPHETQHTLAELWPLLDRWGMELCATSINRFQPMSSREALIEAEQKLEGDAAEALRRGEYFPGFFVFLARKRPDAADGRG